MRYLFGFLCVCVLSAVPLPQSASAQDAEEDATSEPNLQEPTPSSEPASEEPMPSAEPAPGTEAPDIDTLSQRAIEHYEIQSAQSGRPAPSAEPAPEEPALQLKLNPLGGVDVVPSLTPISPVTAAPQPKSRATKVGMGVGIAVAVVAVGIAVGAGVAVASIKRNVMKGHIPGPASMGRVTIVTRAR